jgi:hypothetical protein
VATSLFCRPLAGIALVVMESLSAHAAVTAIHHPKRLPTAPLYRLVVSESISRLDTKVSHYMAHGYVPIGGGFVAIDAIDGNHTYCQALVKRSPSRGAP